MFNSRAKGLKWCTVTWTSKSFYFLTIYFNMLQCSDVHLVLSFLSLCMWLYVLYTFVSFCKLCILVFIFMYYYYVCSVVYILFSFRLPWLRFFRAFSSVVRQMPENSSQRRGTVRTLPNLLIVLFYVLFWIVLFYVLFRIVLFYVLFLSIVLFYVLSLCKCELYYCHRVSTQLQLNISYHNCLPQNPMLFRYPTNSCLMHIKIQWIYLSQILNTTFFIITTR